MAKVSFEVDGLDDIAKSLQRIAGSSRKFLNPAVKKAMNPVLKGARSRAPQGETKNLKKGMKLSGERSAKKGKKVYRLVFDRNYNDVFQKRNKSGIVGGYYPISMEYGFFDRSGKFHEGSDKTGWETGFIHGKFQDNAGDMEKIIVQEMKTKIDQQIAKEGLK